MVTILQHLDFTIPFLLLLHSCSPFFTDFVSAGIPFNFLNMAIYRKYPTGAEKFAQASWLLMAEKILLAQAS